MTGEYIPKAQMESDAYHPLPQNCDFSELIDLCIVLEKTDFSIDLAQSFVV